MKGLDSSTILFAIGLMCCCFALLGVGILFFGRDTIGAECGTVPKEGDSCISKEIGICPMDDQDGYLRMATAATRARAHHHQIHTQDSDTDDNDSKTKD